MSTLTQTDVTTYTIDASHSRFGFVVRHLGFSKVRGAFEQFEGTIEMEGDDLTTLRAEATAQAASINTHDAKRDAHLRTGDFFEAETYPELSFRSTEVLNASGNSFTLVGDLTMRGVTKTVAFHAESLGTASDPWGGTRIAFEASTKVNRKEYGLNWNVALETGGWLVSEEVEIVLEIEATRNAEG